jgi:hypothetical protein
MLLWLGVFTVQPVQLGGAWGQVLPQLKPKTDLPSTLRPLIIAQPQPPYASHAPYADVTLTWPEANPFPFNGSGEPDYGLLNGGGTALSASAAAASTTMQACDPVPVSLWGLEARRVFRSPVCAAPIGPWVAYTEMTYLPALRQTSATVFLMPVLPAPAPVAPPLRPRTYWERHLWDKLEPLPPPPPDYAARNTNPAYLQQRVIPLLKLTFQPPFEFSTLHTEGWSADGTQLWVVQKTAVLHKGWHVQRRWHLDLRAQTVHQQRIPLPKAVQPRSPEGRSPLPWAVPPPVLEGD